MAAWVKCTDKDGADIWLNLDGATWMLRTSDDRTRVWFAGGADNYEDVKQPPEMLIERANAARKKR